MFPKTPEVGLTINSPYGAYDLAFVYFAVSDIEDVTGRVPQDAISPILNLIMKTKGAFRRVDMLPILMRCAVAIGQRMFEDEMSIVFPIQIMVGKEIVYEVKCIDAIVDYVRENGPGSKS